MADIVPEVAARRARRAIGYRGVDQASVERMVQAAVLAPSCFNNQPWRFVVVTDQGTLGTLKEALSSTNSWARRSPCIVAAVTHPELDCRLGDGRDYALFDLGLAVANLVLQGTREGLYAHPIAGYEPEVVKQVLGIPGDHVVATLLIVGHPGDEAELTEKQRLQEHAERTRKPLGEAVMRDRWGTPW